MNPTTDHSRAVARYYDQNTRRFVRWGKNQGTQNIHQALWAEGVKSQAEAVNYANQLIANQLQELEAPQQVMDLGCGVGSALFYLAERSDENIRFSGVTISATQAEIGQRRAAELGLADRCQVLQGDFLDLPAGSSPSTWPTLLRPFCTLLILSAFLPRWAVGFGPEGGWC
jgi:cyclopropane fatty-acyl-phospholipid synthase-like methyltransferase